MDSFFDDFMNDIAVQRVLISELPPVGNHEGTLDYGHYYADCKGKTGQWHRFNDAVVTPTTVDQLDPQTCYVLFYHRVPNE